MRILIKKLKYTHFRISRFIDENEYLIISQPTGVVVDSKRITTWHLSHGDRLPNYRKSHQHKCVKYWRLYDRMCEFTAFFKIFCMTTIWSKYQNSDLYLFLDQISWRSQHFVAACDGSKQWIYQQKGLVSLTSLIKAIDW